MPTSDASKRIHIELAPELARDLDAAARRTGLNVETLASQALRRGLAVHPDGNAVFLSAPVNALLEGIYREKTDIATLKRHGDLGLGTFNDLDGELTMLDGQVYQIRGDGRVYPVDDTAATPFACVTFFTPDTVEEIQEPIDTDQFDGLLRRLIPSDNMLYALRIDAMFDAIEVRSVPRQENYRPLVEVTREQPVFDYRDLPGTLVGFFVPEFLQSLNVPGIHLHFLSQDRTKGGHLLKCSTRTARIGVQHVPRLILGLPLTLDFLTASFTRPVAKDLLEAER